MSYKDKIRKQVLKSFEPHKKYTDDWYWEQNPSSVSAIEKVKEKHVAKAIDEYEQKHKLGEYKPKPKRR